MRNETMWNVTRHIRMRPKVLTMQYGRVVSSVPPTYMWQWYRIMGDRWTIEIGERCLPMRVIETNSPSFVGTGLGPNQLKTICRNLCTDSVHYWLQWIELDR